MENKSCPLIIIGSLLMIGLLFIPNCLAARKLTNIPQNNGGVNYEKDDQSKSGVHGSLWGHAGSATGDNSSSGVVKMSPPIPYERVTVTEKNGVRTVTRTGNGNGQGNQENYKENSPPKYDNNPYSSSFSPPEYGRNPYSRSFSPPEYGSNPFPRPFSPPGYGSNPYPSYFSPP